MKNKKQWPKCPWCGRAVHHAKITHEPITMLKLMSEEEYRRFEQSGRPRICERGCEWYWIRSHYTRIKTGWFSPKGKVWWVVEFALVIPYRKQNRWYDNPKSYAQAVRRLKKRGQLIEP